MLFVICSKEKRQVKESSKLHCCHKPALWVAIVKRSDIYTKQPSCKKRLPPFKKGQVEITVVVKGQEMKAMMLVLITFSNYCHH